MGGSGSPLPSGSEPLSYSTVRVKYSWWALVAAGLGVLGLPAMVFWGAGLVLEIPALVLGVWAYREIRRRPWELTGHPFAVAAMVCGVISVVAFPVIIATILHQREVAIRAVCAGNLHSIEEAMVVYSACNRDRFPALGNPPGAYRYRADVGLAIVAPTGADAMAFGPESPAAGNALAAPWMLVLGDQCMPKQFMCSADPFGDGIAASVAASRDTLRLTPAASNQASYSIAYPWNGDGTDVGDWWKASTDPPVPVVCDMAPLAGTGRPVRDPAPARVPSDGRTWNSFNHGGRGQNVAFTDGHAEWLTTPLAGRDNIFAIGSRADGTGGAAAGPGRVPAIPTPPPGGAFDVIMVPLRDGNTGQIK